MKLAFIDHYDSFSFNLLDWLKNANDSIEIEHIWADDFAGLLALLAEPFPLVLSPGPKAPEDIPATMEVVEALAGKVPILGICLGHQVLGAWDGAQIRPSKRPLHGATREIKIAPASRAFSPQNSFRVAAYNSLVVDFDQGGGNRLVPTGWCDSGEIQVLEWNPDQGFGAWSMQFHPESFLSDDLTLMRQRWINEVARYYASTPKF